MHSLLPLSPIAINPHSSALPAACDNLPAPGQNAREGRRYRALSGSRRRRSPSRHILRRSPSLIAMVAILLSVALPFSAVSAEATGPDWSAKIRPARSLSARDLSKRAVPGHAMDVAQALVKRQSSAESAIAAAHHVDISLSQPATCAPLNITWDPSKGTPPFTLMIIAELWYQLAVVTIPATYANTSLPLWLYQYQMPSFKNSAVTNAPSIAAAIVDSTGKMANTSSFIQVDNSDESCDRPRSNLEFESWSSGAPVQCQNWSIGWNISGKGFVGPMIPFILPERQPPILLTPPSNLTSEPDGTGGLTWTVSVPGSTPLLYSITDSGNGLTGGVGGKNVVAVDSYTGTSCGFHDRIGLPSATSIAPSMTVSPDPTKFITKTTNGQVVTVAVPADGYSGSKSLSTGGIAGVALGIAALVGLIIGAVFLVLYRRNTKKRETLWEMPGGSSNYPKGMPVDRRLASARRAGAGVGPADEGDSVALTLNPSYRRGSTRTLSSADHDGQGSFMSSPPTPLQMQMPYSDISPRSTSGSMVDGTVPPRTLRHGVSGRDYHISRSSSAVGGQRQGSDSSAVYRTALNTTNPSAEHEEFESVALGDRFYTVNDTSSGSWSGSGSGSGSGKLAAERSRTGNTVRNDISGHRSQSGHGQPTSPTSGTQSATYRTNNVVVHSDAGLLLDDSLSDDGEAGVVELPPDYHSVPVRAQRERSQRTAVRQQDGQSHSHRDAGNGGDQDISQAYRRSEAPDTDIDDAAFWRS
ncbi:unnamed protein product [Parajaminaea phylloscopi]